MISILRSLGCVIAGLALAFVFIAAAEFFSSIFHPWPSDIDPTDMEACRAHVARYPTWVLAACTAIWAIGPFAGAWLATRIGAARHAAHGVAVGVILLLLALFNISMLPYPNWFPIVTILAFILGTLFGTHLAQPPRTSKA